MKKLLIVFCMTVAVGLSYAIPPDWTTHRFTVKDKTVSISMPDTALAGCFFHPASWEINMAFWLKDGVIMTDINTFNYNGMASKEMYRNSMSADSVIIVKQNGRLHFFKEICDSVWLIGTVLNGDGVLTDSVFRTATINDTMANSYPMKNYRPFKVRIIDNDSVKNFALSPIYDDSLVMKYLWNE